MLETFKKIDADDAVVSFRFVDPMGKEEKGVGASVIRDAYSSFWSASLLSLIADQILRCREQNSSFEQ